MIPFWLASAISLPLVSLILLRYRSFLRATIITFPLSIRIIYRLVKLKLYYRGVISGNRTAFYLLEENVRKHPNKVMLYFDDQTWTYKQVDDLCNKVANYFAAQGLRKGDVVSLLMENCPENVCIWLGLSKLGVVTSIVNTNLLNESLSATLLVGDPKATIFHESTAKAMQDVVNFNGMNQLLFSFGPTTIKKAINLESELKNISNSKPKTKDAIGCTDEFFYLYTSGSTGLPKAVSYTHARFMSTGAVVHFLWGINSDDIIYTCLPLYHSAAATTGVGCTLTIGASMVLRRKFSASKFWQDCVDYKVTVVQYIGEICRYLLRQPARPEEKLHRVQKFVGSGLREEIWKNFKNRFQIPFIGELYGATESSCGLMNFDGTVGAIGFIPRFYSFLFPAAVIKIDENTGEPVRDPKTGLGIKCGINEPGEWVGKIIRHHSLNDFPGYKNAASDKKILRNIFKHGDEVYRSNDMLVVDELGYVRFKDRAALNYRWKGENISAVEVENTISRLIGFKDVAAYGVKVPGSDGSAGMISIADPDNSIQMDSLLAEMRKQLPAYAIPLFVRKTNTIETTGTYKTLKKVLQAEAYDINKVQDKIYLLLKGAYVPLDNHLHGLILSEAVSL